MTPYDCRFAQTSRKQAHKQQVGSTFSSGTTSRANHAIQLAGSASNTEPTYKEHGRMPAASPEGDLLGDAN